MVTKAQASIEDLYHVPENGKAEIVNGELVLMAPTGFRPSRAASVVYVSLLEHERRTKSGYAIADNAGFKVDLPNRASFSPDAAWYTGKPTGMKFLWGAPSFAVEVRSEGDYGAATEHEIAGKRHDYFAAGTLCVWDMGLLSRDVIRADFAADPERPVIFRRGDVAHAGDAVPGWSMAVDELFTDDDE
ncbi:MAG TPA: Uma2 family endonuclease [Blastocatellia bacterium]